jgi:8-oxo-dGTP pyrophosphatase MutT (NUDIX family)
MNFDEFSLNVSKIKNIPLPGQVSQFKMAPPFRKELLERSKDAINFAKKAGVLALFYPDRNHQVNLVLILRKTYEGVHSGQVGFPGGKLEIHDTSLEMAALRETHEEIGVASSNIKVLTALTELYIPPSNFYVQPYLGISSSNLSFYKDDAEVEEIIEVPIKHFFNEGLVISKKVSTSYNIDVEVPAFYFNDYVVWGATAMILSEIKDLLKQLL